MQNPKIQSLKDHAKKTGGLLGRLFTKTANNLLDKSIQGLRTAEKNLQSRLQER